MQWWRWKYIDHTTMSYKPVTHTISMQYNCVFHQISDVSMLEMPSIAWYDMLHVIINQSITLLSLKRICIVQLMIYNMWDGHNKMQVNSRCIHYKNSSTGWQQYESFSIQHSNGHRHKTPAIARCFTFYTTVSPSRRKYMEERRERVIRLTDLIKVAVTKSHDDVST